MSARSAWCAPPAIIGRTTGTTISPVSGSRCSGAMTSGLPAGAGCAQAGTSRGAGPPGGMLVSTRMWPERSSRTTCPPITAVAPRQPVERRQVAAGQLVGGGQGAQQNLRLDEFAVRQLVQRARPSRARRSRRSPCPTGRCARSAGPRSPDRASAAAVPGGSSRERDRAAKQRPGAPLHHRCGIARAALVRREHAPGGRQGGRQPRSLASAASARFRPHQ